MKIEVRQKELKFTLYVEDTFVEDIDAVTAEAIRQLQSENEELKKQLADRDKHGNMNLLGQKMFENKQQDDE